jgi:NHL repeat
MGERSPAQPGAWKGLDMSLAWLKADVLLGSIGKLLAASLLFATLGVTGCGTDPVKGGVTKSCTLNSDCNGGLVCSFGLCHKECATTTDCPAGQRCVQTDSSNVCQLSQEAQCHFNSDCSNPLVCAIDRQCRNQCNAKADCLDNQECADHVCAEPREVDDMGGLVGAIGGAGGEGNTGTGATSGSGGTAPGAGGDNGEAGMPPVITCVPGGDCVPEGMPCQLGTVTCDNDVAGCTVSGDADDGTDCDADKVCSAGVCTACTVGDACSDPNDPDNTCISGTVTCANGPDCDLSNVNAGTGCGTDQVCDGSGTCADCKVDDVCDPPGQACKDGKMACSKGPVCTPTTTKSAGSTCDTGKVCDSGASCVACVQNDACEPQGQECHLGQMDCVSGPNCVDTLASAPDGASCTGPGAFNFCTSGVCAACAPGNPCIPANKCHKGTLNCATTPPTCNDSQANAVDGLECGDNQSCISGECLDNDRKLAVTSGSPANVAIDAPFGTVTVTLLDKNDVAVPGAVITVTPPLGAYAAASNTSPAGKSQITGRVGRAIGANKFTVSAPGATSIDFTVNGIAPSDDNLFTLVNVNHLSAVPTTPIAGTLSKLYGEARAMTAGADGTLYLSDYGAIFQLSPQGLLTRIAGDANESAGNTGDNGPGTSAQIYYPTGVALDETQHYLYIAQSGYPRVRLLDLASKKIYAFAGDTAASNTQPWGDEGPADAAYVSPTGVAVAPNSDVFISDNNQRIRRVDGSTIIHSFLAPGGCVAAGPMTFTGCGGYGDACSFAWDKTGQLYISGQFCGDGFSSFNGVARVTQDVNGKVTGLTHVAGRDGSANPGEGGTATGASFTSAPGLAFDKAGNLYLSTRGDHRVRRIDSLTDQITTVAGTGTLGFSGDYALGSTGQVYNPTTLAFDGANNLYFADSSNIAIRGIWNVGDTTAQTGKLATTAGNNQTVKRDAPFSSLTVKVTDGANAAIPGVPITWKRLETGSGLTSTGLAITTQATGATGSTSMTGRVGLASGAYHFEASYNDIHGTPVTGSPQSFTITAEDPAAGIIFPVVNYPHGTGPSGTTGPACFAKLYNTAYGIATASDGTIYVSDYCSVYKVTPRGEMTPFAGTGACGATSGDSGPATGATFYYPQGLALDETNGILYIADNGNQRIRMVTLSNNKIYTFAGGGSVSTAPWGEGGPPTSANIGGPTSVTVGPDGKVYFPDTAHYGIWVVDPFAADVKIQTYIPSTYPAGCTLGVTSLDYATAQASVHFNAAGEPYVSGYLCQGTPNTQTYGIAKYDPVGKTMTRIAGLASGGQADGAAAVSSLIPNISDFIFDANDNIVLLQNSDDRIRYIDMTSGLINTIVGDGTAGYSKPGDLNVDPGAYEAASGVRVSTPFKLALWNGHILFTDQSNYAARMIW